MKISNTMFDPFCYMNNIIKICENTYDLVYMKEYEIGDFTKK